MKLRNRLVAIAMTAVMTVGQSLAVYASESDNATEVTEEVVISEAEEETAEEVIIEDEYADVVEEAVSEEEPVEVMNDAVEAGTAITFDQNDVISKEILGYDEEGNEQFRMIVASSGAAAFNKYAYADEPKRLEISDVIYPMDGNPVSLDTTIEYNSAINYRSRKIKAKEDLSARVSKSGLYDVARSLSPTGNISEEIISWKMTAKKNKNAGTAAYFTVKASVKKSVAKSFGITGKSLKKLKKAVKIFNKAAKKQKAFFIIDPLVLDYCPLWLDVYGYTRFGLITITKVKLHAPMEEGQENYPESMMGKWPVISSKDYKAKKQGGFSWKVTITAKQKNVIGNRERVFTPDSK
ncbi:MAG: hypothetical protein K6B44_08640 [Lachnospiraceae bacterium]|nr:hypothetical protein [Lachnospiraceae bacterium]